MDVEDISWKIRNEKKKVKFNKMFGGEKKMGEKKKRFMKEKWREELKK
jgi:hypothetical protein